MSRSLSTTIRGIRRWPLRSACTASISVHRSGYEASLEHWAFF